MHFHKAIKPKGPKMEESKLVRRQEKTFIGKWKTEKIIVRCRWDDCYGNGHNSLAITGETKYACGCLHSEILEAKGIPVEIKDLVPFHLCGPKGPLYYIENTIYHVKNGNLDCARNTAVGNWPEGHPLWISDADLGNVDALEARRPLLVEELRKRLEAAGFQW